MSNIPCAKNRKMSPCLHFTLLTLKQSNPLFAAELPTEHRQLAVHAGFLSGRHLHLGPVCVSLAQRGQWALRLGLTLAPTAKSRVGETSTRWIRSHREALWTGLDCGQCTRVVRCCSLPAAAQGTDNGFKCCYCYLYASGSFKHLYRTK